MLDYSSLDLCISGSVSVLVIFSKLIALKTAKMPLDTVLGAVTLPQPSGGGTAELQNCRTATATTRCQSHCKRG